MTRWIVHAATELEYALSGGSGCVSESQRQSNTSYVRSGTNFAPVRRSGIYSQHNVAAKQSHAEDATGIKVRL